MAVSTFDFAVFGTTPFAGLLAGLLASKHGKRVCLVHERWSPLRLPQRLDLAVDAWTRPETWELLRVQTAETIRLVGGMGRGLVERLDPLLIAERRDTADALAHARHMAAAFGYAVEPLADRSIVETGRMWRFRDVPSLAAGRIEPAIAAWLQRSGVRLVAAADARATLRRDGSATLELQEDTLEVALAVLADDEAILRLLDPDESDALLQQHGGIAVLSGPARPLPAPVMHFLDRDVLLVQRGRGPVLALAGGAEDEALRRIGASLGPAAPLSRAGQARFRQLATADGAPLLGPARGLRAFLCAGMRGSGAFLAPAVARHLTGSGSESERAYFARREPPRGNARQQVADFVAPAPLEAAA